MARLAELSSIVEGPRVGLVAEHAAALGDPEALAAVSARWGKVVGDLLAAADSAAQAAVAYRQDGRPGAAVRAAGRAHGLAERAGGLRTPAVIAAARPLPLTNREREIVTLAGQGLSNRAIADRLGLSVRTVKGHLYRSGEKLGITHRAQLGSLLVGMNESG